MDPRHDPHVEYRQSALIATLRRARIFTDIPHEDLAEIADGCEVLGLQKGALLFHEGQRAEGFYVVQLGQVAIQFVTPTGRQQVLAVFRAGDSFGEAALAELETFPAHAVALGYCRVILIRTARFKEFVARNPQLALRVIASLTRHLHDLVRLLQSTRGQRVEARLAEWLMLQSPAAAAGCPAAFELPVPKMVLAGQLGVSVETLSRTFAHLRERKILRVTGARIVVLDAMKLRACVAPGR